MLNIFIVFLGGLEGASVCSNSKESDPVMKETQV